MLPQVENSEKKGALQEVEALVATVGTCDSLTASLYLTLAPIPLPILQAIGAGVKVWASNGPFTITSFWGEK